MCYPTVKNSKTSKAANAGCYYLNVGEKFLRHCFLQASNPATSSNRFKGQPVCTLTTELGVWRGVGLGLVFRNKRREKRLQLWIVLKYFKLKISYIISSGFQGLSPWNLSS
ncbi:hypothetical protein AVEN_132266-1 [Araneus ventricosus]|uniref:Uncharacterized protein n=1 Tax=Araneus ventricosus TaxID=182803 RepID=A0A4Y2Q2M2_ARAVE|nr:hypothetical protein AVEN_132266-1 [Araneus ventricosus]